jgi:hypothetical protein
VIDVLRKLSLLAIVAALALSLTGTALAKNDSPKNGNAYGHLGFSDGH